MSQEQFAETPWTPSSPGENQESGPQAFLLSRDETPGAGLPDDETIALQIGQQSMGSLITYVKPLREIPRGNEPLSSPPKFVRDHRAQGLANPIYFTARSPTHF